jgi:methyltransferase
MTLAFALVALAFVPMLLETGKSAAHERALRAAGAVEPSDDVYKVMQIAYPASFLAMILEAWLRGRNLPAAPAAVGAAVLVAAKGLKYWAMATLGPRWTFRVLVPAKSSLITGGPYRFLRHPNYVGVIGELLGFALLAGAPVAGAAALAGFGWLLRARIRVEERALGLRQLS